MVQRTSDTILDIIDSAHLFCKAREILLIFSKNTSMGTGSERLVVSPYIEQSKGQKFCALPLHIAIKMTKQGDEGITKDH